MKCFGLLNGIQNSLQVARPGRVFILGGCCDENEFPRKTIAIFEKDVWRNYGQLKQGRTNFMTITYGTDVMIIGGITTNKKS